MRRIGLAALLFGACGDVESSLAPFTGPVGYEARHYDFALELATRRATATVTLVVRTAGDCVTIPFGPEAAERVALDGIPADRVAVQDGTLTACDGRGLGWDAGEAIELQVVATVPDTRWGRSQVGFSRTRDLDGHEVAYLLSWVGECDRHGPCDDAPDRFATYRFAVTHDPGWRVLCPGVVVAGDTETTCDFSFAGGPTYSTFGIIAADGWTETTLGDWGGVTAKLYDVPASGTAAAFRVDAASGFVAWMSETFGPYPYGDELRFVVAPTYWSGFEHPGNIVLSQALASGASAYADGLTHVVLHEIAHMWAGDETTLAGVYDFVWKEAMAEYLAFVYEEERLGADVAAATAAAWKSFSAEAAYFPSPGEKPPLLTYYGDVYGPGPMILFRQLERIHGRSAILAALAAVLGQPRALSLEDLRAALELATGSELGAYFNAWIYGTGAPAWPTVDVALGDAGGGQVKVDVALTTADGKARGCRFTIQLQGAGEGEVFDVPVELDTGGSDGGTRSLTVAPGFAVTSYVVDPYAECLVWDERPAKPRHVGSVEPWRAPPR